MELVDGAPITLVFGNGTSTAVAIAAGSFDDTARSRFDLIAFIDDLGNVIVMAGEVGRDDSARIRFCSVVVVAAADS